MYKIIYKFFRKKLLDEMVKELLSEVPDKVQVQAIELLAEKKSKFQKFLLYQAYYLQRRDISDMRTRDITHGSLIQIKAMLHLVNNTKSVEDGISPAPKQEAKTALSDDLERVKKFKNREVSQGK